MKHKLKSNINDIIPFEESKVDLIEKLNTTTSNFLLNYYMLGLFHDVFSQLISPILGFKSKPSKVTMVLKNKPVGIAEIAKKLYNCLNLAKDAEYEDLANKANLDTIQEEYPKNSFFDFSYNFFNFRNTNENVKSTIDDTVEGLFLFPHMRNKLKATCKPNDELSEFNSHYCYPIKAGDILFSLYMLGRDLPEYIEADNMEKYISIGKLISELNNILNEWASSNNIEIPEICNDILEIDSKITTLINGSSEAFAMLLLEDEYAEIQKCNTELLVSIASTTSEPLSTYPFASNNCFSVFYDISFTKENLITPLREDPILPDVDIF